MTYEALIKSGRERLEAAGVPEPVFDAAALLEKAGGPDRTHYPLEKLSQVPDAVQFIFDALIGCRANRVPLQHILGETWFMGLPFTVNEDVLIPRADTECLVEAVLQEVPERGRGRRLLDLCTGSGCIGISLARHGLFSEVVLSDLSGEALGVARENIRRNDVSDRVKLAQGDLTGARLERAPGQFTGRRISSGKFDVICGNPPYIAADEIETLMPEVRDYDPRMALDGGADGLDFYRRLAKELPAVLSEGGQLFLEIGEDQGESVPALFTAAGFREIRVIKDLAGLDRVVYARRAAQEAAQK